MRIRAIVFTSLIGLCAMQASAQTADLLISKSGTEAAAAGNNVVYSIYVFNGGPADAQNVVVTDALPSGTTFVSLTASTGLFICTMPPVGQGGTVRCTTSTLANQADTSFTLTVKTAPNSPPGSISNTATITSSTTDGNLSDNSSTVTTGIAPTPLASTDLSIESMLGSSRVTPGATMSFQIVIANRGLATAHNVQLVDAVPLNATFVSATVTDPLGAFTCATPAVGTGGNITCMATSFDQRVDSDQPAFVFTFRVNNGVAPGMVLTNTATLSSNESDPDASNNTVSRNIITTSQAPSADLSVATFADGANFAVRLSNAGPNDAADVTLVDTIPGGSTFQSWTQTSGPALICNTPQPGGTGTITCTTIAFPGIEGTIVNAEFELVLNTSLQVANNVSVSSSTSDPRPDNNFSSYPVSARLTIDDGSVVEGDSGVRMLLIPVHLQPANANLTATVRYQLQGITATAGTDFDGTGGTVTFLAGETLKNIAVPVFGDVLSESNEVFSVQLSDAVNASIERDLAFGTIIDDDFGSSPIPAARIDSITVTEGNTGTTAAVFTVRLSNASSFSSRIRWQTQDGSAKAGSDYIASSGEVVFLPGETAKTFVVPIIADNVFEPDEFFNIVVTGADNASIPLGVAASGSIRNDDSGPQPKHRAVRH
jgi:uncharacterized repeat protein (TIGR01451 family)